MSSDGFAIRVEGVSKRYELYGTPQDRLKQLLSPLIPVRLRSKGRSYSQEFWALRDVSLEVKKGEAVGILGRNGSGKSTLLQIIAGTLEPTMGRVEKEGRIAALLELGSGFNPEFTGRENVYLNAALLGFSKKEVDEIFDEIASFADIGDHIDQPVKTYSSGMMLRLAFSVQVQVRPDILIVDEALAVGDALFQKRCFQKLEKLRSDGVTLLFVSHDQESVRTLTTKSMLLQNGRVVATGTSSEVVLAYRRQLHRDESLYFTSLTEKIAAKTKTETPSADNVKILGSRRGAADEHASNVSERNSFGEGEVEIVRVETLDANGDPCSVYYPGDSVQVRITCKANVDIGNLNVALRIRNKEGVKIYSWGTLNQDMFRRAEGSTLPQFWDAHWESGQQFSVTLMCECALGVNLYEVQVGVSFEETPDYMGQRILHWKDEAAFFQVLMKREEYHFGGVVDLRMRAVW